MVSNCNQCSVWADENGLLSLLDYKTYRFSTAAFIIYLRRWLLHGLAVLSLHSMSVTNLPATYLVTELWALATC